ncbi:DUF2490 domain-containing protein [Flammeovirga kamogawensis]|uniref:DUF2490 domain-containing protein n=1 Tax=Flammeovirga kamogawensis TaxID=373891 RepID=A0ABX8H4U3_9BACT|nr:DUF2490 domain-containing protein [Flammeovirga kamogawensis]MBB6461941.1 hypothetical protein [Flammeovirga kamogawensis]QWG10452.1 DUF2490 domain-containing protein [Flammeovirga kamogawensis]TRX63563.1 DUF2490 domain-containing protein [Flammeovirga kamogawensis]
MRGLILIVFLCISSLVNAQDMGQWGAVYGKARFSDRLGYYAEHHARFNDSGEGLEIYKSYNRMGLNYFVNNNFDIVVGPAVIGKFNQENEFGKSTLMEYRIWHQYVYHHYSGRVKFYHQVRIEHVWADKGTHYKYRNRYRYKAYAYIPINKRHVEPGAFYVVPSVEIFMHDNSTHSLEDFRVYNAIGYKFNETTSFTAGHMWTWNNEQTSNVFRFSLYIDLDLRK